MKILSKNTVRVIQNSYQIELESGRKVNYSEYLDEKGKVIDCEVRDENGHEIDDPGLYEQLLQLIDELT